MRQKKFPIWKTIKLGTGLNTADDFHRTLKDGGFKTAECGITALNADEILYHPDFTIATEEIEVDLVIVDAEEQGFKDGVYLPDFYPKVLELGNLELCPPEVGPQSRLQYRDQPEGESLLVAMEPVFNVDGLRIVFKVHADADDELWLNCSYGLPSDFWRYSSHGSKWVFVYPSK